MATLLRTRTGPLQFGLARLEQDAGAILGYHQEISRRITYLLPPLGETPRLTVSAWLHASLSERQRLESRRPVQTVCSCSRNSSTRKDWTWQIISLAPIRQRCAPGKNRHSALSAYMFRKRSPFSQGVGWSWSPGSATVHSGGQSGSLWQRSQPFAQGGASGHAQPAQRHRRASVWPAAGNGQPLPARRFRDQPTGMGGRRPQRGHFAFPVRKPAHPASLLPPHAPPICPSVHPRRSPGRTRRIAWTVAEASLEGSRT